MESHLLEDDSSPKLFKDVIKGHECLIEQLITKMFEEHLISRSSDIALDFMHELEDIPISREDSFGLSYEMKIYVKDILRLINTNQDVIDSIEVKKET